MTQTKETLNKEELLTWARQSADELQNGSNACYFRLLGDSNCKTGRMYLVVGWSGGFENAEEGEPYADGEYRVCCKLAYNDSSLQCDYDIDWTMPYDEKDGEVDDTDSTFDEGHVSWLIDHWKALYAL